MNWEIYSIFVLIVVRTVLMYPLEKTKHLYTAECDLAIIDQNRMEHSF